MLYPTSVTVLISGRGSNLVALHERARGYRINAVISSTPEALGLKWAKKQGIPTVTVARSEYATLAEFKAAVLRAVQGTQPDIVALAGFMVVLQPEFVTAYSGRLVNIHPSLLPKFPGLDTHRRAIEAGEQEHGATVHFVADGVDTGAIIAQGQVPLYTGDTEDVLAARTLALEHTLYPWVLKYLAAGEIALSPTGVTYSDRVRSAANEHGFTLSNLSQPKGEL